MKATLIIALFAFQMCLAKNGTEQILDNIEDSKQDFEVLILEILVNTLQPFKCVVFLCDEVYYDILKDSVFKQFGIYISYFVVIVENNEDLLSPYSETKLAMVMAKRQDCQSYVITLSNGLQSSRFLKFGDRYRLLDTRAKFILLYDQRLFEPNLLYLWKRIVNVIFIREYSGTKAATSVSKKNIPWFEISTVPFPSPIKGIFLPRRLDIWRKSKFRTGTDLFRDKTSDLRNQTLRVVTFPHIPATTKIIAPETKSVRATMGTGSMVYAGLEIEILNTIADAMNFRPIVYEPENAEQELWGQKKEDGQLSGLFGEMIRDKADIALGDLYYTPYILELMDLTTPYTTECLTFLTPESLTDNSWKTLIMPFKSDMWTAVIICFFLSGIIFYALGKFHHHVNSEDDTQTKLDLSEFKKKKIIQLPLAPYIKNMDPELKYTLMKQQFIVKKREGEPEGLYLFHDLPNSFLYTFSMLVMVSMPKLPTGWSLRILTGWYWVYCILVVVAYRASMTAILANPAPRVTIDNLEQLLDSKLDIGGWGDINREFFRTSLDPLSQLVGEKFELVNDSDAAIDRVAEATFAFYENVYFLKHSSVKRQLRLQMLRENLNSSGAPAESARNSRNLHIMSDCVINMPISIGLQRNSPIKPRADKFVKRVIEAGLIKKWLDDVMQKTLNSGVSTDGDNKALMSMKKLYGAVVQLLVGYAISLVVFIGELVHFHMHVKKHPQYDKYYKKITY